MLLIWFGTNCLCLGFEQTHVCQSKTSTSMHSSRMHTTHLCIVWCCDLGGGALLTWSWSIPSPLWLKDKHMWTHILHSLRYACINWIFFAPGQTTETSTIPFTMTQKLCSWYIWCSETSCGSHFSSPWWCCFSWSRSCNLETWPIRKHTKSLWRLYIWLINRSREVKSKSRSTLMFFV